jgi:hypothetical protein
MPNGTPIGIYTYPPDEIPGVTGYQLPDNVLTQAGRKAWEFADWLDSLRPTAGDVWRWLT